ncbi:TetR/AcrR family transcriptional regulator [Brevibacillus fluminis]|uniref:TetR/AcrR family transcriptional regulator n=1 Tax=Brevibacillus fluminis TaxID=511487 RepID=A0A3M8DQZ6_9BACL|nr:TetR/AcrR family transcriptional regulator [Brevibacillus fluminis]RNB89427.1 TetR/AcrR family transcriptional regulator [Brevibacillus fluminis]
MSPRMGLDLPTILQAAAEIADAKGWEEVTLAALAQKLEIRSPSLYNHVDGLSGLRKKLAVYGLDLLYERLVQATVGVSGDDAVIAFARAYLSFARAHPGLYPCTQRAPEERDDAYAQRAEKIVELIVRVLQGYGLQGDEALHTIRGLRSLLHGFALLEKDGGFGLPLDLDTSFSLLIDTFLAGIHSLQRRSS